MSIIRSGCNYGSKSYFPNPGKNGNDVLEEEIMQAFVCQFYDKNIVKNKYVKLKVLGTGELKEKLTIKTDFISKSAKDKIEKAGGQITVKNQSK